MLYHPPIKRSVDIGGRKTSISLEPLFWDMLKLAAKKRQVSLRTLVAQIDQERACAAHTTGLAGAIRLWIADQLRQAWVDHEAEW